MPQQLTRPQHDTVITFGDSHWPAWTRDDGILVDLRLFDPDDRDDYPALRYYPEKLARYGVPDEVILAGADSNPEGFVLL